MTSLTRRHLQVGLGLVWILDAALQFQPYMFSNRFGANVIGAAAVGQPEVVAAGVRTVARLVGTAPAAADAFFAVVQLALGLTLLHRRTARWALVAALVWPLGVWYFGEGLGGVLSGHASLVTGAPGAALLYALVAMAAWVGPDDGRHSSPPSEYVLVGWAVVWGIGALLQGLPGQSSPSALAASVDGAGQGGPGWLAHIDHVVSGWVNGSGGVGVSLLITLEIVVALGVFGGPLAARVSAGAGGLIALGLWAFGQSFGQVYSGQSTDPNTGPLLLLMAAAVYSWAAQTAARPAIRPRVQPAVRPGVQPTAEPGPALV